MKYRVREISGVGAQHGEKLARAGITDISGLLRRCGDRRGRRRVAGETGIEPDVLLAWANMADLMRIPGVGRQFAELLGAAGVDTVKELAGRDPESLAATLADANGTSRLTRRTPTPSMVARWIARAGTIEPRISH